MEDLGVHNLNLVTPSHFAPVIFEALRLRRPGIPVVWNSSGYETVELVEAAAEYVDVFLPDLKYFSAESARQLAGAPDYFPVAMAAIRAMCRAKGAPVYDGEGLMQSGTLVRHLILPLRTSESLRILDAIARELPAGTPVSLMRQYTPVNGASLPGLDRRLTHREYARVRDFMLALGLEATYKAGHPPTAPSPPPLWTWKACGCFGGAAGCGKMKIFRILGVDIRD